MSFRASPYPAARTRLALALRGALLGSAASLVWPLAAANAAPVERADTRTFNLPAAAMEQALKAFAQAAGINFTYDPAQVQGLEAPALQGTYTVQQGLAALLTDSGYAPQRTASGNWTLARITRNNDVIELASTQVTGQGMGQSTEGSGSYTTPLVSAGSKTPVSLRDTPQSVSVVTDQLIKDRQIHSLGDALRATPGITVKNFNYRTPRYYSRGFEIKNIQIDGAASLDSNGGYSNHLYEMTEFDHVEVLRGSAGLFGGVGDPGGIINLVRKRPLDHDQLQVELSAGSWDNYRTQIDVTGPLGFDGALRGRLVTSYTDRQYFQDNRGTENPIVYGVLEADLTPDTLLTVGGRWEKVKETGTGDGLPRYSDGSDVGFSRHYWPTTSWSYSDHSANELFVKLDHQLAENWRLNASFTHVYDTVDSQGAFIYGNIDPVDLTGPYWEGSYQRAWSDQSVLDVNLASTFQAFGQEHEWLIGADAQQIHSRWRAADGMSGHWGSYLGDWPAGTMNKDIWRDYRPNKQKQYGVYSTLRLQLADPLKLIIGARATRYSFDQTYSIKDRSTSVWNDVGTTRHREPTKVVPFGGLVYALDDEWSLYGSYSEIFNPQALYQKGPLPGSPLEPMVGKTYETGVKGELAGGRLNVSAALFYAERENQGVIDPSYDLTSVFYAGSCCYLPRGKVTSKGIDLEVSGELTPGWEVLAGYTFNRNEDRTNKAIYSSVTPKHQAKIWNTYVLPGVLSDWKVGGGMTVQSGTFVTGSVDYSGETYIGDRTVKMSQGGYAVWDAMVEYQVDPHWTVTLNVNNLFDRHYYDTLTHPNYANYYGTPRNYMLTLRGTW